MKKVSEALDKNNNIVICPEDLKGYNHVWKVFLAGPVQGAAEWQFKMPFIDDVVWLSPRRRELVVKNFDYNEQVEWETHALRMANIVIFWIPEPAEDVSGRSYAQTTRFELGENFARGKRIIIGAYKGFPGRRYLEYKVSKYKNVIGGVFETIDECVNCLKEYIDQKPKLYFTSDTHFSSERALELSKRPFASVEDMDWSMIERWNNTVNPKDTVWHLGDFGDNWPLDYLSGFVKCIIGNYERDGKTKLDHESLEMTLDGPIRLDVDETFGDFKGSFILAHEPIAAKEAMNKENKKSGEELLCLFGHIHGRQRIKKFGIDVGVDCNNYTPISLDDVNFFMNAIRKGYYDDEVWKQ